jgi:Mrp family chromosome partitioning ATPase
MRNSQGAETHDSSQDMIWHEYAGVVRRYWWALALLVIIGALAGFAYSATQPPRYRADAKLWCIAPFSDTTLLSLELNGVNATISRTEVSERVEKSFDGNPPSPSTFKITAHPRPMAESGTSADPLAPTRLVVITAEANDADLAAKLATAYAKAFVIYRTSSARASARKSAKIIRKQLAAFDLAAVADSPKADYVAATYLSLTQQLSQYEETATTGNGGYVVLADAMPPNGPYSPQPLRTAFLGAGIGVLLAFALVIVLQRFSDRVSGEDEIASTLGAPIIGRIIRERTGPRHAELVSMKMPSGRSADAYHRLRASLPPLLARDRIRSVMFSSVRGDAQVSMVAANVAVALARTGRRVVVVDTDLGSPSLHEYFGVANEHGLTGVLEGRLDVNDALQAVDVTTHGERIAPSDVETAPSLYVLTSGADVPDPGELVARPVMAVVMRELLKNADIVLLGGPALLGPADAVSLVGCADGLVMVVDPRGVSRRDLRTSREMLDLLQRHVVGIVLLNVQGARRGGAVSLASDRRKVAPTGEPTRVGHPHPGESS